MGKKRNAAYDVLFGERRKLDQVGAADLKRAMIGATLDEIARDLGCAVSDLRYCVPRGSIVGPLRSDDDFGPFAGVG